MRPSETRTGAFGALNRRDLWAHASSRSFSWGFVLCKDATYLRHVCCSRRLLLLGYSRASLSLSLVAWHIQFSRICAASTYHFFGPVYGAHIGPKIKKSKFRTPVAEGGEEFRETVFLLSYGTLGCGDVLIQRRVPSDTLTDDAFRAADCCFSSESVRRFFTPSLRPRRCSHLRPSGASLPRT